MSLAMNGGTPVHGGGWPPWPQADAATARRLAEVLHGGRWAVSGPWVGRETLDVAFGRRFAEFVGVPWCLPVDHGSSALLAGLHALGVRPGDEVIVPGLTWVAPATVVVRAGAVPILVDIDPRTLTMDPAAVRAALTTRTTAIIIVHLYGAMADMDELLRLARQHGLATIEDAAQVHGARWNGRGAGSLGDVGAFSMQQGKLLTAGEGGAVVTSRPELKDRLELLRSDGRRYAEHPVPVGRQDLEEVGVPMGWNMNLSELQAALLLDGLERLPEQNRRRAFAARWLDEQLAALGLEPIAPYAANDTRAYYHYAVRIQAAAFADRSVEVICRALSAELGAWIHPTYRPLDDHPLYQPHRAHPFARLPGMRKRLDPRRFALPQAHREHQRTILFHHPMLLGDRSQLQAMVDAVAKVQIHARSLPLELAPKGAGVLARRPRPATPERSPRRRPAGERKAGRPAAQ